MSTGETGSTGTHATASTGATGATGDTGHPPFEYDDRGCVTNASRSTESMYLDIYLNESNERPGQEGLLDEVFAITLALYTDTVLIEEEPENTPVASDPSDVCEWTTGAARLDGTLIDGGEVTIDIGPHHFSFPYMPPGSASYPDSTPGGGFDGYSGYGEGYHAYDVSGFPPLIDAYFGHDVAVSVEGSKEIHGFSLTGQTPPRRLTITEPEHFSYADADTLVYRWEPGASLDGRLRVVLNADWLGRTMSCSIEDDGEWSLPEVFVDELEPQLIGVTASFHTQPPCIHDIGEGRTAFANIVRHNEARRVYLDMSH